jgi:FkbM family methyltransferase
MSLSREHVIWAYRLLLDREPENDDVVDKKARGLSSTQELRAELVASEEYREKNRDFAQTNERNLVIKDLGEVRVVVDLSDHAIGLNIIRGRFETNELAFAKSMVRPGDHALDCGAHVGLFALHLAHWVGPHGSVTAFEPLPGNAECLELAIRENRVEDRLVLERAAVGDRERTLNLVFVPRALNSGGAFVQTDGTSLPSGHESIAVRMIALDRYRLRRPVRFMKIDVEGAEPLAMRGAAEMLRADRPAILSELHPRQLDAVSHVSADAYLEQMRSLGYRCHVLGADGRPAGDITSAPDVEVMSVVFLPG